jgi:hypothetical protein
MLEKVLNIGKWTWLPALLMASLFTPLAGDYAGLIHLAIWLAAIFMTHHAVRRGNYFWAAEFLAATLAFSPLYMVDKIFLLLALASVTTVITLVVACRTQPVPVAYSA